MSQTCQGWRKECQRPAGGDQMSGLERHERIAAIEEASNRDGA